MPRKANFIFEVQIRIPEAFTLDSIVRSPRTFKPKDVASACQNNELVVKHGSPPPSVVSVATYVMTDFFAMAHGTGLYNRQPKLWESLAQVNSVHVYQLTSGIFNKTILPVFDFSFQDYKGKPLLYANLVQALPDKQKALSLLKGFIGRAQGKPSLTGVLSFFCAPVPADVLDFLRKQTDSPDPIVRYEAVLSAVRVPFDLLEMNTSNLMRPSESTAGAESRTVFALLHPDIKSKQEITQPTRVMRKVMPKPKKAEEESEEAAANESGSGQSNQV